MLSTYEYLIESAFHNLFYTEDKERYADEVWKILNDSYAYIGGFKTYKDKTDMINKSFMWKLNILGNEIVTVTIYKKDENGFRKSVASAINRNFLDHIKAKRYYTEVKTKDVERCYMEISGKLADMMLNISKINEYVMPVDQLPKKLLKHIINKRII